MVALQRQWSNVNYDNLDPGAPSPAASDYSWFRQSNRGSWYITKPSFVMKTSASRRRCASRFQYV
jgi:hypothetical protein